MMSKISRKDVENLLRSTVDFFSDSSEKNYETRRGFVERVYASSWFSYLAVDYLVFALVVNGGLKPDATADDVIELLRTLGWEGDVVE